MLIDLCRDFTEPVTVHSMAQCLYLYKLMSVMDRFGDDHTVERDYLNHKLSKYTGFENIGGIGAMFEVHARYAAAGVSRFQPMTSRWELSGRNIRVGVNYKCHNIPMQLYDGRLPKGVVKMNENIADPTKHTFSFIVFIPDYQHIKNKQDHASECILMTMIATLHELLPEKYRVTVMKPTSTSFTNLDDLPLSIDTQINRVLGKDMRFNKKV